MFLKVRRKFLGENFLVTKQALKSGLETKQEKTLALPVQAPVTTPPSLPFLIPVETAEMSSSPASAPSPSPREHVERIRRERYFIGRGEQNPLAEDMHQAVNYLSQELYSKDVHFLMELVQVRTSCSFLPMLACLIALLSGTAFYISSYDSLVLLLFLCDS